MSFFVIFEVSVWAACTGTGYSWDVSNGRYTHSGSVLSASSNYNYFEINASITGTVTIFLVSTTTKSLKYSLYHDFTCSSDFYTGQPLTLNQGTFITLPSLSVTAGDHYTLLLTGVHASQVSGYDLVMDFTANTPLPPSVNVPDQTVIEGVATDINISQYASDPNGYNTINYYDANYTSGIGLDFNTTTGILKVSASTPAGSYDINVSARDITNLTSSVNTFTLFVTPVDNLLCYGYQYKQQGAYFTETNDGNQTPNLIGFVDTAYNVSMELYIRNRSTNTFRYNDLNISILDMNTSQVTYVSGSAEYIEPGDTVTTNVGASAFPINIHPYRMMPTDSTYIFYDLHPVSASLDTPIDINVSFKLNNTLFTKKLGMQIKMCTPFTGGNNSVPEYTIYNVESANNYADQIYSLPTQVVKRADNFKVVSYDINNLNTRRPDLNTTAFVELIEYPSGQDPNSVCANPLSSISERISVKITNGIADFNATAIDSGSIDPTTDHYDFWKKASRKAGFRVSYNVLDENGSILDVQNSYDHSGNFAGYYIKNFTELASGVASINAGWNLPVNELNQCRKPVDSYLDNGTPKNFTQMTEACGNASPTNGISAHMLAVCMECVYGYNVKYACSRDFFAIRPEALMIAVNDQNQTNPSSKSLLGMNTTSLGMPLHLAAGYQYDINLTATNFHDNNSSFGYDQSSVLAQYGWQGPSATFCNDVTDHNLTGIAFVNGAVELNTSLQNVGNYLLNMVDANWTYVDTSAFTNGRNTNGYYPSDIDCVVGNSDVQSIGSVTLNGCNTTSAHVNNNIGVTFHDYNITFHPYKFDLNMTGLSATGLPRAMTPSVGLTPSPITPTSYIYMADMSKDQNMSYHLNGYIRASGYNDSNLSNFVGECYGKPIDINITKAIDVNNTLAYQYRFNTLNVNDINISTTSGDLNNTTGPVQIFLSEGNFTDLNGSINSNLNLNFFREVNSSMNPRVVTFHTYSVDCQNADVNCTFKADLTTKTTNGTLDLDHNVSHIYGRTHAPRYRFKGPDGNATIYYESHCNGTDIHGVACNKVFLPNGAFSKSTNDPRWFQNISHAQATYGVAGNINQKGYPFDAGHVNTISPGGVVTETTGKAVAALHYNAAATIGYPYRTTMENNASNWLIYNKYDANDTKNEFPVEFWKTGGKWAGKRETNTTTHSKGTERTNRRSMW